jgi:hypothetical protein
MEGERHLIVEGPDGSIAIAFNQEVPPPEPPVMQTIIRITGLAFCEKGKAVTCIFCYIAMFMLTWFFRFIDIVNACLMFTTLITVVTGWSNGTYQIMVHGILSIMTVVPLMVIDMWGTAIYQLGVAVLCLYLNYTVKYVTSFQLEP